MILSVLIIIGLTWSTISKKRTEQKTLLNSESRTVLINSDKLLGKGS